MMIKFDGEMYTEVEAQQEFEDMADTRMEEIEDAIKEELENDDNTMMELAQEYCKDTDSASDLITYDIYELVGQRAGDTNAIVELIESLVDGEVCDVSGMLRYSSHGYLEAVDEEALTESAQTYIDEIVTELIKVNMITGNSDITELVYEHEEIEEMEDLEDWAEYYDKEYEEIDEEDTAC